jgi:hypothetical protein
MVMYMHLVMFFICLNFGLGIAHIPDTPLTIPDASATISEGCTRDMYAQGLLERIPATGHALSNGKVQWVPATDSMGNPVIYDFEGESSTLGGSNGTGVGTGLGIFNPLTEPLDIFYTAGETFKNVVLGGYVTNVLDSITFSCDIDQWLDPPTNTVANPTFGQSTDSEVMTYMKAGIHIIFGLMLFLLIFYIITGKQFGL